MPCEPFEGTQPGVRSFRFGLGIHVVRAGCLEIAEPAVVLVWRVYEGAVDWDSLSRPENYLGDTGKIIDIVLRQAPRPS